MEETNKPSGTIAKKNLKEMIQSGASIPKKTFEEADRKKGGRPRLESEQKVSKNRLTVYLSDSELEEITTAANAIGMKAQAFVKMTAFTYIKKDIEK